MSFQRAPGAAAFTNRRASPCRFDPSTRLGCSFPPPNLPTLDAQTCRTPGGARAQAPASHPLPPHRREQARSWVECRRRDPSAPPQEPRSSARIARGYNRGTTRTRPKHPLRPSLMGIRQELLEARDSATLGRRHPAPTGAVNRTWREYRRPDDINPWRRAQFDDDRASTQPGYEGSSADHYRGPRRARDPAGSPHANMYDQHCGGGTQGWLREDIQRGYPHGAHLLVGSFFGQTSGSGVRGPIAWGWVDAPSYPSQEAPAWGLRVEHTPMFPSWMIPT
ncbi:uncharacterized protein LOC123448264 [Hordeum vulgare subsp. vulgare]|uniref:Predicted protein n=1 Tax=Hordeum vulgare subsp. vulgare TaxID=112509 RepID=F2DSG0_HORVV|nr:uncharacterized protein LOC123448264 [Hordeum vulgare subsp. vulgare]BAJ98031.1 predicted protein [Hordeum vulgare subsp. vulgare]